MKHEEWKTISGIDDAFISSFGRVKSCTKHLGERILTPQIYRRRKGNEPRLRVMIDRRNTQGKAFYIFVHTVVAEHFLPPSDGSKLVFRDRNPLNCSAFNLAWMHDFDTVADHVTLQRYRKFESDLGKACFQHCLFNKAPLEKEIAKWSLSMPRMIEARFNLSETEADEAYWTAATKFIQKVPTGFIDGSGENVEGLLFSMMKIEAKYMQIAKYKHVSEFQCSTDEYNFIDSIAHADFDGSSDVWSGEEFRQYA